MAAKGYCTTDDVELITGDLTTAQEAQADTLIEAAEAYLDAAIGRGWIMGVQTLEAHYYPAKFLILKHWPVDSVALINGRGALGDDEEALTVDEDYEVVDLAAGMVRIVSPGSWDRLRATYTPTSAPPADVARACAELTAQWMQNILRPQTYGLDSYSLPDLSVKFSRSHMQTAVPPFVEAVIEWYRVPTAL